MGRSLGCPQLIYQDRENNFQMTLTPPIQFCNFQNIPYNIIVCAYCGRETNNRNKSCEGCAAHKYIIKKEDK